VRVDADTSLSELLTGPNEDIPIHPSAQSLLDYEGELVVVIGADAKNVSEEEALSYVLGYTIGNDISARNFQLPDVSGGQFCYAKSFDKFAPIGPAIITPKTIPDPQALRFTTTVNGEKRQDTSTDNMIWTVKQIIHHLSRGTTLKQGTIIMTGTPSGASGYTKGSAVTRTNGSTQASGSPFQKRRRCRTETLWKLSSRASGKFATKLCSSQREWSRSIEQDFPISNPLLPMCKRVFSLSKYVVYPPDPRIQEGGLLKLQCHGR
jgi:hypothetical protein